MTETSAGRWILSAVAATTAVGGYLADWNRTHLFNPEWPPHAKFHDAQTIALGSLLGCGGLFFLWRRGTDPDLDLALGALLPAAFWVAQGASYAFPGTGGLDAEFPEKVPTAGGVRASEWMGSSLMRLLAASGYLLEQRRFRSGQQGPRLVRALHEETGAIDAAPATARAPDPT
jgi:hypothetical protein